MHAITFVGPDLCDSFQFEATCGPFSSLAWVVDDIRTGHQIKTAKNQQAARILRLEELPAYLASLPGEPDAAVCMHAGTATTHLIGLASSLLARLSRPVYWYATDPGGAPFALSALPNAHSPKWSHTLNDLLSWRGVACDHAPVEPRLYSLADKIFDHVSGRIPRADMRDRLKEAFTPPLELFFPLLTPIDRRFFQGEWLVRCAETEIRNSLGIPATDIRAFAHLRRDHDSPEFAPKADLVFAWKQRLFVGMCLYFADKKADPDRWLCTALSLGALNKTFRLKALPFVVMIGADAPVTADMKAQFALFDIPAPITLDFLRDESALAKYFEGMIPRSPTPVTLPGLKNQPAKNR